MREFEDIYLSWRPGQGKIRHVVGVLHKHADGKHTFKYLPEGVAIAKNEGFLPYTEFHDVTKTYNGSVVDVFAQRLIKAERSDIQTFYDFWEVDPKLKDDKFYLLGHTQGLVPTDNFEFLADYNPVTGLHFLTDLAHLTEAKLPANTVQPGDVLTYQLDAGNAQDEHAVKVFKGSREIGFVKKVHCKLFHKAGNISLTVKAVDQNGVIKRIFVKVQLP